MSGLFSKITTVHSLFKGMEMSEPNISTVAEDQFEEPIENIVPEDEFKEPPQSGNLYFDFDKNREDFENDKGRKYPGLVTQVNDLKKRWGETFFPDVPSGEELLNAFVQAFFPEGITQSYCMSNLSLWPNQEFLSIRPQIIGPRLEQLIPRGMSFSVCGKLWDHKRDENNPVFLIQRIVDMSHCDSRPFEQVVTGFVYTQSASVYPGYRRSDNVLPDDFVSQLPAISIETKSRLKDWQDYLDWRERLVRARLVGLRYLSAKVLGDGRVRFLTVCESKEHYAQLNRILKNNDLFAYPQNYSTDPWEFSLNDRHRGRGSELGDFARQEMVQNSAEIDLEGMPWNIPYFAYVYYRLPEDAQNEFDGVINEGGTSEQAALRYLDGVASSGFLALSVVGDMSLIRRQRSEVKQLQEQSGYAPFLSSYLFDINAANEPTELQEIQDSDWLNIDLNKNQKLAVRKMISTPDLAMVQGPPGTGKTTMIAEATWQLVRESKKVLLVSQASLAVNNALERLPQIPSIRAIRLSNRERKNEREHPYSKKNALGTYYGSIAKACSDRTLNVWEDAEDRLKKLRRWMDDSNLIADDLEQQRSRSREINDQLRTLKAELSQLKAQADKISDIKTCRINAEKFIHFINGDNYDRCELSDEVLSVFYDKIILPLGALREVGINANTLWNHLDYGSSGERTRFAGNALTNWRNITTFIPQLSGELGRLKGSGGETVLSTDSELRLAELKRTLAKVSEEMMEDENKVSEWRSIQKQIREVKRSSSSLDVDLYRSLFNIEGNEYLSVLTNSSSNRQDVVNLLGKALLILEQVQARVEQGESDVKEALASYRDSFVVESIDEASKHRLEGEIRHQAELNKEVSSLIANKEQRLSKIMRDFPGSGSPDSSDANAIRTLQNFAQSECETLEKSILKNKPFRDAWGDILSGWVDDLTDRETIRSDQDHFFNTYAKACNVIGVTCTEKRSTLDDLGHMWFDTVIVDEVSKATPTEIIMPLMMGRTAILVGDHRQLPPLFKENEGSWEEVLAEQEETADDNFSADSELTSQNFARFKKMVTSSLFKEHFENAPDSLKSFLLTQYRMHPQIMRVVNQFYQNSLECGLEDPDGLKAGSDPRSHRIHGLTLEGEKRFQYVVPERHVVWLDSTLCPNHEKHYERRDLGSSKVNELECILIAKALCDIEIDCRKQGYGAGDKERKQVGIVTFYGRQVRAIREAIGRMAKLKGIKFKAVEHDINTVDRYQGQERPIILVSMVRHPNFKLSRKANTAQFERINVAFSRAQELLIVAGAKDVFCKYPVSLPHMNRPGVQDVEVYRYIIDEIQRNGGLWPSDCILAKDEYQKLLPNGYDPKKTGKGSKNNRKRSRRK